MNYTAVITPNPDMICGSGLKTPVLREQKAASLTLGSLYTYPEGRFIWRMWQENMNEATRGVTE